jgi:UDP-N-acetylmuramate dehydrogenase
VSELRELCALARAKEWPVTILGGGSNVLVPDVGVAGLVIQVAFTGWQVTAETATAVVVEVAAGHTLDDFVAETVTAGWWGLENLSAIPGTVGATPVQNVGAYGVEVAHLIESVLILDPVTDTLRRLRPKECRFGYRDSVFKQSPSLGWIVCAVEFRLAKKAAPQLSYRDLQNRFGAAQEMPTLRDIRSAVIDIRSQKFPDWHVLGTAGSFFKNPIIPRAHYEELLRRYSDLPHYAIGSSDQVKIPLGWILDHVLKMRGYREGSVSLYEKQSLVLVNHGGATAREIDDFAKKISDAVAHELEIVIEREVRVI